MFRLHISVCVCVCVKQRKHVSEKCVECEDWHEWELLASSEKVIISFRKRKCERFGCNRWGTQSLYCCWGGFWWHYWVAFHELVEKAFSFSCPFCRCRRVRMTISILLMLSFCWNSLRILRVSAGSILVNDFDLLANNLFPASKITRGLCKV